MYIDRKIIIWKFTLYFAQTSYNACNIKEKNLDLYQGSNPKTLTGVMFCTLAWNTKYSGFDSRFLSWKEYSVNQIKIKSVACSSQGSHNGQLDFCNWLADGNTTR